jgi:hypothetical protein
MKTTCIFFYFYVLWVQAQPNPHQPGHSPDNYKHPAKAKAASENTRQYEVMRIEEKVISGTDSKAASAINYKMPNTPVKNQQKSVISWKKDSLELGNAHYKQQQGTLEKTEPQDSIIRDAEGGVLMVPRKIPR